LDAVPQEAALDTTADALSKKYLQSTLLLNYATEAGITSTYANYDLSILKQTYVIEEADESIKVIYTIGDTKKEYLLPPVASESRMNVFLEKMDDKQIRQINSYYKIFDLNKLSATDNKSEIIALYPDIEKERVYVLRDNVQDYLKEKIQELFVGAGYTQQELDIDKERYLGNTNLEIPVFQVSMVYQLDEEGLIVEVPFEEMIWKNEYQ
jgi:hypothetical protein